MTGKVVVCMPAYRAALTIAKTLHALPPGCADELLVVDDASPDNTVEVARRLGLPVIVHPVNRGYGGNQKTCYDEALRRGADIVVLLHPDFQYDPASVPALVKPLAEGRADFTFGSRFAAGGNPRAGGMPLYRYVGNRLTTAVENLALGTQFAELHSGLKAYTRPFLEKIDYHKYSDDFVFDSQMVIEAIVRRFRIVEVPIPTRYEDDSSSVSVTRSLKYIAETLQCLWQVRTGQGVWKKEEGRKEGKQESRGAGEQSGRDAHVTPATASVVAASTGEERHG